MFFVFKIFTLLSSQHVFNSVFVRWDLTIKLVAENPFCNEGDYEFVFGDKRTLTTFSAVVVNAGFIDYPHSHPA